MKKTSFIFGLVLVLASAFANAAYIQCLGKKSAVGLGPNPDGNGYILIVTGRGSEIPSNLFYGKMTDYKLNGKGESLAHLIEATAVNVFAEYEAVLNVPLGIIVISKKKNNQVEFSDSSLKCKHSGSSHLSVATHLVNL